MKPPTFPFPKQTPKQLHLAYLCLARRRRPHTPSPLPLTSRGTQVRGEDLQRLPPPPQKEVKQDGRGRMSSPGPQREGRGLAHLPAVSRSAPGPPTRKQPPSRRPHKMAARRTPSLTRRMRFNSAPLPHGRALRPVGKVREERAVLWPC